MTDFQAFINDQGDVEWEPVVEQSNYAFVEGRDGDTSEG